MTTKESTTNVVTDKPKSLLRATHMGLFPTFDSVQDVLDFADSKLPIVGKNDITTLLMTFQNTLLHVLEQNNQLKDG